MGWAATVQPGGYSAGTPGDSFVWIAPRLGADGTKPAVIACHGATSPQQYFDLKTFPNQYQQLTRALADAGYPIIAPKLGGDLWANDTALGLVTDAKTYAQTHGAKAGPVILLGVSMGGATAYAWARANLASVACIINAIPVSDLQDFVTNNRGGFAASVNAAYGGAYSDGTYGATHNPAVFKTSLAAVPTQVWYATDDTLVIASTVTAVTAAITTADVHSFTGGHTDAALGNINPATVLSFIQAHT